VLNPDQVARIVAAHREQMAHVIGASRGARARTTRRGSDGRASCVRSA
jgi:hypothetical protein